MAGTDGVTNLDADGLNKFLSFVSKQKVVIKAGTLFFSGGGASFASGIAPAAQNIDGLASVAADSGQATYTVTFTGAFSQYPVVFYQIQRSDNNVVTAQPIFVQGLKTTDAAMKTSARFGFFLNSTGALLTTATNMNSYITNFYLHIIAIGVV